MATKPKKIVQKKVTEKAPAKVSADEEVKVPPKISNESAESEEKLTPPTPAIDEADEVDYLRKYQYKRELPLGDPATDPQMGGKAALMKAFLLSQPKVTILIPLDEGSDPKVPYSVTLNGYRLDLPTNTYVEVPHQIAEVIMQSQKQTVAALDQFKSGADALK